MRKIATKGSLARDSKFHHVNESLIALVRAFRCMVRLDDTQGAVTHLGFYCSR